MNGESRGTGLRPQRPVGWEKSARIDFSPSGPNQAPQGDAKGPMPTSRSMQAPIPGEIGTQLEQAPGGFLAQQLMGRPGMQVERARPGDDGNIVKAGAGMAGGFPAAGKGPGGGLESKPGITGGAAANPHIGAGKGGF